MIGKIRIYLLEKLIPATQFVSKFHRPEMLITGKNYEQAIGAIKNGDIVVSLCDYTFTNYLIPGDWSHVGVYYNGLVYEAVTHGVRSVRFDEWMYKKDHVGILRPKWSFTEEQMSVGLKFLQSNIGEYYDFAMNMNDVMMSPSDMLGNVKSWFCSKYVYAYLKSMNSDFSKLFTVRDTLGEPTVVPSDYWQAEDKFERILKCN